MFRGIHGINLDPKGRLAIPTRYREGLLTTVPQDIDYHLVATIDTEAPCLLLYPATEWEMMEAKLQGLPSFNPAARRIQRLLLGHATELALDKHGRVLIAPLLREYAGLNKKVVLIGQGKKFEIWDETQWNSEREQWLTQEAQAQKELPPELQIFAL